MVQDEVMFEAIERIDRVQKFVDRWLPEFKAPGRFFIAHADAIIALDTAENSGRSAICIRTARDAYRQAANELEFSLQNFILEKVNEIRSIVDAAEKHPELRSHCLAMRRKIEVLDRDIGSRDSNVLGVVIKYGELVRLLSDAAKVVRERSVADVVRYA